MDQSMITAAGTSKLFKYRDQSKGIVNNNPDNHGDLSQIYAGCTANVALVYKNELYVANSGDSRSVLCSKEEAFPMSYDHKPDDSIELNRIHAAGGFVSDGRVNGNLNLSRAMGDFEYKGVTVSDNQR